MGNTRNDPSNTPIDVSLTDLPHEIVYMVSEFISVDKPHKTMRLMSLTNKLLYTLFKPDLTKQAVKKALELAADASADAVPKLLEMLANSPKVLLEQGNVFTRSGVMVENVTVYEFLLGAGDPDLAEQVAAYFAEFEGGEEARITQYEKYKPCIDRMLEQQPYDLTGLIDIIKQASPEDVQAVLNKQTTGSVLDKALESFRQAVTVNIISTPQMHYNYQTLIHAFDLYNSEWLNLYIVSTNPNMLHLVWRQVIGYLQRGLPAVDRFAFTWDIYILVRNNIPLLRDTKYQYGEGSFPNITLSDSSLSGLGFDYAVLNREAIWAGQFISPLVASERCFASLCRTKISNLQNLYLPPQNKNFSAV